MNQPTQNFVHESQKERWIKYGANVGLVSLIVIALAILVGYLAQKYDKRLDTTIGGLYSLKPQTVNIIKENTQKVKLVSLYSSKAVRSRWYSCSRPRNSVRRRAVAPNASSSASP